MPKSWKVVRNVGDRNWGDVRPQNSLAGAAEQSQQCFDAGSCSVFPSPLRNRAAFYTLGLPAMVGTSYLSYSLEKHGSRWWFVSPALFTIENTALAIHVTRYPQ